MNKTEFVDHIAEAAGLSKTDAGRAYEAMVSTLAGALKRGDTVTLTGFGTFAARTRAARTGRNPKTGEAISIAASKAASFKPGKGFKDAIA